MNDKSLLLFTSHLKLIFNDNINMKILIYIIISHAIYFLFSIEEAFPPSNHHCISFVTSSQFHLFQSSQHTLLSFCLTPLSSVSLFILSISFSLSFSVLFFIKFLHHKSYTPFLLLFTIRIEVGSST